MHYMSRNSRPAPSSEIQCALIAEGATSVAKQYTSATAFRNFAVSILLSEQAHCRRTVFAQIRDGLTRHSGYGRHTFARGRIR